MKKTLYINFYGAPGVGKSTGAAWVFSNLKLRDIDSEYVQEFAKDMVWENNRFMFDDPDNQLIIMASQFYRLNRLNGKVDIVVTDSPLFLSQLYVDNSILDCEEYKSLVRKLNDKFTSLNILVKRAKKYNPNGRNQNETESDRIAVELEEFMKKSGMKYNVIQGTTVGYQTALDIAMVRFNMGALQ